MLKCFITSYRIRLSMLLNRWVYYFQKVPIIKQFLPNSLYGRVGIKGGLSIVMVLGAILIELFKKAFYVILVYAITLTVTKNQTQHLSSFIQLFLFFSVLCGSMNNFTMFMTNDTRRVFLKTMRFDSSLFIRTQVLSNYLIYAIFMTPCMIIAMYMLGGNALQAIGLIILAITCHLLIDFLQMKIYAKKQQLPMIKHSSIVICLSIIVIVVGVLLGVNDIILDLHFISNWFILSIILAIPILLYINRYPYYTDASRLSIMIYDKMMSSVSGQNVGFQDVVIRDSDANDMKMDKHTYVNRKGYDYLNALFFHRQKRIFYRPVRNRIIFISVISIATIVFGHFTGVTTDMHLNKAMPFLVFIMYFLSVGNRACRSLFYNCDVSLLEYSFYRRKDHILRNFIIRLRYMIGYNLVTAIVLCIYVVAGTLYLGITCTTTDIVIFVITILLLSILFSVHYLFLYYVFQPYTRDFNEKNPMNSILSSAMYIVCYMVSQIDVDINNFVIYVMIFTITYILIAIFCTYRYAPKTFRIR